MDLFLYCKKEDVDWACEKFDHTVAKNFLRKVVTSYYDRVESLFYLVKFYFLLDPPDPTCKSMNNREFLDWLFSQRWDEKTEKNCFHVKKHYDHCAIQKSTPS